MFKELYARYIVQLSNQAYKILLDAEQTKDVLQEIFLNLYLRRNELPPKLNPGAYLNTSVRNKCLNVLRDARLKQKHHQSLLKETVDEGKADSSFNALELRMQLNNSINALEGKSRDAFLLRHYGNKSHREIGSIMNISTRTVEKHISKAVHNLRKELNKNNSDLNCT